MRMMISSSVIFLRCIPVLSNARIEESNVLAEFKITAIRIIHLLSSYF